MSVYQKKKKEPYDQRTATLTPEEQKMREENLRARESFCYDGVKKLSTAVCLRSVIEYRRMIRRLAFLEQTIKYRDDLRLYRDPRGRKKTNPDKIDEELEELRNDIRDCEDFFDSDMFVNCTGLEGKNEAIRKILKLQPEALMMIERRLAKG